MESKIDKKRCLRFPDYKSQSHINWIYDEIIAQFTDLGRNNIIWKWTDYWWLNMSMWQIFTHLFAFVDYTPNVHCTYNIRIATNHDRLLLLWIKEFKEQLMVFFHCPNLKLIRIKVLRNHRFWVVKLFSFFYLFRKSGLNFRCWLRDSIGMAYIQTKQICSANVCAWETKNGKMTFFFVAVCCIFFFTTFHYQCSVSPSLLVYKNYNGKQQLAYHILYHRIIICTAYCFCIESIHLNITKRLWWCGSVARVMFDCIQICINVNWVKNGTNNFMFFYSFVFFIISQNENIFMKIRRSASFGLGYVYFSLYSQFQCYICASESKMEDEKEKKNHRKKKRIVVQCNK